MEIRKVRKAQGGQDGASLIVSLPKSFCNQIGLLAGDSVYIDLRDKTICIEKIVRNRLKEDVFQTIRMLGERTVMTYQRLRDIFPEDPPEDISNALEELLHEGRISGDPSGYRAL